MWKVVDDPFNRANYQELVGRVFPTTKGYAIVEEAPDRQDLIPAWRTTKSRTGQTITSHVAGHKVQWWTRHDETDSGIDVDGVPHYETPIEIMASIMTILDLGKLLRCTERCRNGPYWLGITDAFAEVVDNAVKEFLSSNVA